MKFVKEFVIPALVLTIICVVVSAALVATYNVTEPIIELARAKEADAARIEVLPEGDSFEKVEVSGTEGVVEVYKAKNGAGYVITTQAVGYAGSSAPVNVMTGITADGTITSTRMMTNSETAGIGSKVGESTYTDQYKGKDYNLDGVEAVSGATVTSGAYRTAVEIAFQAYGELAGVEIDVSEPLSPQEQIFPGTDYVEFELEGAKAAYMAAGQGIIVVVESKGYSDAATPMEVYVGFGTDLKIAGVALGENTETKGLGSQVGEADYTQQYKGKDGTDGIAAISGATESSDGFKKGVNAALELLPAIEAKMPEVALAKYTAVLPGVTEVIPFENENAVEAVIAPGVGIVAVTRFQGYNTDSPIQLMVGISEDGTITGVKVVSFNETDGIGTKVLEEGYPDVWVGKTADGSVAAVSGATVTSTAFQRCIQKAFQVYEASKGA